MRGIFATVMVILSKVPLWKLLVHNYVQSSFSTSTRLIDNSILKTPYSWKFYGHAWRYVLILSSRLHRMKTNADASKIITCKKIRLLTSRNIALK